MRHLLRLTVLAMVFALGVCWVAEAQWTWTPQTGRFINLKRLPKETDELQIEFARGLLLEGKYDKALNETKKFTKFYPDSPMADENQYLRGEILMADGEWMDAAEEFQLLLSAYPDTERYDDAIKKQYEIADMYYEKGQESLQKSYWFPFKQRPINRAIDLYGMVVDNQPFTPEAAEGQYKIGLCRHAQEQYLDAAYEYQRVIEDYGDSEWADESYYGMVKCFYDGAFPSEYDQTPSHLAINSIDIFKEKFPEDTRNEELGTLRQEMRDTIAEQRVQAAEFYEKRRKFVSAKICYEAIVEQFDDTPSADVAKAWLAENESIKHIGSDRD